MSTTVGYVVEVKKNGKWEPVLPLDLRKNMYDNTWLFINGGFVRDTIDEYIRQKDFPKDSPTLNILKEMYPKHTPRIREWLANKYLEHSRGRFISSIFRFLIPLFKNEKGAFNHTWGHSWATLGELDSVDDKLEEEIKSRVVDYSNFNTLINEVREAVGKRPSGDYNYDIYYIMEGIYKLEAWEKFKGGIEQLAEVNEVDDPENIRAIWWME